jgi:hypothetical protein
MHGQILGKSMEGMKPPGGGAKSPSPVLDLGGETSAPTLGGEPANFFTYIPVVILKFVDFR